MSQQTPLISRITQWLGIRRNKMWLRYKDDISPRTIPKPNLPPTSNAKLAGNYYYTRDQRRKAGPPTIVSSALQSTAPQLEAGSRTALLPNENFLKPPIEKETPTLEKGVESAESSTKVATKQEVNLDDLPTPGFPTQWTISSDQPYLRK